MKSGFRLLMVDDAGEDVALVRTVLEKSGCSQFFHAVARDQEAIAYLLGEGKYADRQLFPVPNTLLLGLKTPGIDGSGLLTWLQDHPEFRVFPTIVFSTSFLESDVSELYAHGASAFLARPSSLDELIDIIHATYNFWSRCHTPPPPTREPRA